MTDIAASRDKERNTVTAYLVVGEDSGDALGAELVTALRGLDPGIRFAGTAGRRMRELGLESLFDINDIAVMGLAGVASRLPLLMRRIRQVAADVVAARPDILVLIDSPDFNHRVAKRVRRELPDLPIVKYVCPSVWAWRPGRAKKMRAHIDHVLALLPFEPQVLEELGGPEATYVGHPLTRRLADAGRDGGRAKPSETPLLAVLPGSRRNEIRLMLPDIRDTLALMASRGTKFRAVLPAVPHLEDEIREAIRDWPVKPEIVSGEAGKHDLFARADAALAVSGTVVLELALYRVPTVSIYRVDWLMHAFRFLITGWTAALPNLICDDVVVPERIGEFVRPGWLARALEGQLREGAARQAQLDGFERMAQILKTDEPAGEIAARKVMELAGKKAA